MTGSRFAVGFLAALLGAAWSFQAVAQAPAQPGKPLLLRPPQRVETPAPSAPAAIPATPAPAPQMAPGNADRVQEDALQAIDADAVGTLSAADGGFGETMWQGTPRALIDTLLPRLPIGVESVAMRSLTRRLLLTAAVPPKPEPAADGQPAAKPGGLIAKRIGLLVAMGDLASAEALMTATPSRGDDPALARIEADVRFLANDNARACTLTASHIRDTDSVYWQKALIFCQALAGEHAKAALGVGLLRELGTDDKVFYALVDALAGSAAPVKPAPAKGAKDAKDSKPAPKILDSMPSPTPLTLAMARAANLPLPADVLAPSQPSVLRVVATSPNVPVEMRLEAGERAEAAGALPTDTLRQLYMAVNFSEEALANPLSRAEAESGPLSRALLYRTALIQTVPTAQAEAVSRALALARKGGRYPSAVRTFMPILKRIPPSTELLWFAPEMVRSSLVGGEADMAKAWFGILRASALFNPESAASVTALRPVLRLAGSEETVDWTPAELTAWWDGVRGRPDDRKRAELLFSLLDAFGDAAPEVLWAGLLDKAQRVTAAIPQPALWFRLRDAATAGRVGETVLLSLLTLGDGGPAAAEPVLLHDVLARLKSIQREADARALAVEAVLAAGL